MVKLRNGSQREKRHPSMLHDFSMTVPLSRPLRDRLLSIIDGRPTLPVRLVVFGNSLAGLAKVTEQ